MESTPRAAFRSVGLDVKRFMLDNERREKCKEEIHLFGGVVRFEHQDKKDATIAENHPLKITCVL